MTSGSFGDQTYSKSAVNEAGETSAVSGGFSGGTRQNRFVAQFDIASTVPGAQQAGLSMSVAPDRGDGGRMSYLRFEDQADGIHVIFDDYRDVAPFGTATGDDANGCGTGDDFTDIDIATISRTAAHTIRFEIDFVNGPRNDVVRIYIDGVLKTTGTTWEDYYRYCSEQAGGGNQVPTVDSLLLRTAGTAVPANAGKGFFFDNMNIYSPATLLVDDNGVQCPTATFTSINAAITAASTDDIIQVCAGSYNEDVAVNKSVKLRGAGSATTTVSGPIGGCRVNLPDFGEQRRGKWIYHYSRRKQHNGLEQCRP